MGYKKKLGNYSSHTKQKLIFLKKVSRNLLFTIYRNKKMLQTVCGQDINWVNIYTIQVFIILLCLLF